MLTQYEFTLFAEQRSGQERASDLGREVDHSERAEYVIKPVCWHLSQETFEVRKIEMHGIECIT
jgi:hypothetical protein